MTIAFSWLLVYACVSIVLVFLFSSLFRKDVNLSNNRRVTRKYVLCTGMGLLLIFLSACSGLTSSNESATPTVTPLALTVVPQPTATPDTPTTSNRDWTTYHADNQQCQSGEECDIGGEKCEHRKSAEQEDFHQRIEAGEEIVIRRGWQHILSHDRW